MIGRIAMLLIQGLVGLLLAGLLMALLVPVGGDAIGPGTALAVALFSVFLVLVVGQVVQRSRARAGHAARRRD